MPGEVHWKPGYGCDLTVSMAVITMYLPGIAQHEGGFVVTAVVKTRIVTIGNSKGIRIPKPLLEQAGLEQDVELELRGDELVLRPVHPVRHKWDDQFKAMAAQGDDRLLDGDTMALSQWDEEEWSW